MIKPGFAQIPASKETEHSIPVELKKKHTHTPSKTTTLFSVQQVIPSDSSDRPSWNSNKLGFERDPAVGDGFGGNEVDKRLLVSLLNENGAAALDSG